MSQPINKPFEIGEEIRCINDRWISDKVTEGKIYKVSRYMQMGKDWLVVLETDDNGNKATMFLPERFEEA